MTTVRLKSGEIVELTPELFKQCSRYDDRGNPLNDKCEQPEKLKKWAKKLKYQLNKADIERGVGEIDDNEPVKEKKKEKKQNVLFKRCSVCKNDFQPEIGEKAPYVCPNCQNVESPKDEDSLVKKITRRGRKKKIEVEDERR